MKGFLVIGFNNRIKYQVDFKSLEDELGRKNIKFLKGKPNCNLYENIVGYQFFKTKDEHSEINPNIYIEGDLYGDLYDENRHPSNYATAVNFLSSKKEIEKEHVLLDGNATFCSIYDEKIIFQNDLEGYKKVFYFRQDNILCLTNYLPLLFTVLKREWKIRKNAVMNYLLQRESKWPLTFIEDVLVLPPMSKATLNKNSLTIESKTYSSLYNPKFIEKDDLKEQLLQEYIRSVERKVSAKTAVTLSGGVDSNCLTKLFKTLYQDNFTAVSVGYESIRKNDGNVYDETIYAEQIAKKLKIPFKRYFFDKEDFFNNFDGFIDSIDQPGHDPSSNYMLNVYLKADGFDTVVNGMGGDACFASKKQQKLAIRIFNIAKKSQTYSFLPFLSKSLSFRGPFSFFKPNTFNNNPEDFHSILEAKKLLNSPNSKYVSEKTLTQLFGEKGLRKSFFLELFKQSKSDLDLFYSLALFTNPDEYHAALMAERNNMEIIMPLIDSKALLMLMNGNYFHDTLNRDFEKSIFGGIEDDLLLKGKSGFSIPYSEWLKPYSSEVFEFYSRKNYFSKDNFDLESFSYNYLNDVSFSNLVHANQIVWKLLIIKNYMERYGLCL